jgi:hypothetical protein
MCRSKFSVLELIDVYATDWDLIGDYLTAVASLRLLRASPQPLSDRIPPVSSPQSSLIFGVNVDGEELKWWLLDNSVGVAFAVNNRAAHELLLQVQQFFSSQHIKFTAQFEPGPRWLPLGDPCLPLPSPPDSHVMIGPLPNRTDIRVTSVHGGVEETVVQNLVGPYLHAALYVFRAERMNVSECNIEGNSELKPDASNLGSVLLQLAADPDAQQRFTTYLRTIFPTIYSVISRPTTASMTRIEVIIRDAQSSEWNPGISIPLSDSGTGISQVLAILYVVVTARTPRVIVIDEPNSFLHPGAAKTLLSILRECDHQYIITTHSPEIIRAVEPEVLHLLKWNGREVVVETLDRSDIAGTRNVLQELGVRLSDVFGADNVLWVEGDTEEICFPKLLKYAAHPLSAATAVVAMVNTGDLESRRRYLAWRVYERLSAGSALVPPALAFSFDREGRTETQINDIIRMSRGMAHFLPRRTYENYLLDADAIRAVLNLVGIERSVADVAAWIAVNGARQAYFDTPEIVSVADPKWHVIVNAPKLLHDLFGDLSVDAPIEYRKVKHSVALTEWLIEHNPSHLKELLEYLVGLMRYPGERAQTPAAVG